VVHLLFGEAALPAGPQLKKENIEWQSIKIVTSMIADFSANIS
jgi:hypothetical protein